MEFFDGEHKLMEVGDGIIVLTNFRVYREERSPGFFSVRSITLDAVSSCRVEQTSSLIFIVIAIAFGLVSVFLLGSQWRSYASIGFLACFLSICLYYLSRKAVFVITSANGSIGININPNKIEPWLDFIDALDEAKISLITTVSVGARVR